MSKQQTTRFQILLLGDGGSGKTTFLKRHRTGEFETKYIMNISIEEIPITFQTTKGFIELIFHDTPGQTKFQNFEEISMNDFDAIMIMLDLSSSKNDTKSKYIQIAEQYCPSIPIFIYGNKIDLLSFKKGNDEEIKKISCKTNYKMDDPILDLMRFLIKDEKLELAEFVSSHFSFPEMNEELIKKYEQELEYAMTMPLPSDDEDF